MPVSVIRYTDREPGTIVEVIPFRSGPLKGKPREVVVQIDDWVITGGSERDGSAEYRYTRNLDGPRYAFTLGMKGANVGRWIEKGSRGTGWKLALGYQQRYCNPYCRTSLRSDMMA